MLEAVTQIVNLGFFILPNAYVLARPCAWRGPIVLWSNFVMFTCWNTLFFIMVVSLTPPLHPRIKFLMYPRKGPSIIYVLTPPDTGSQVSS